MRYLLLLSIVAMVGCKEKKSDYEKYLDGIQNSITIIAGKDTITVFGYKSADLDKCHCLVNFGEVKETFVYIMPDSVKLPIEHILISAQ